MNPTVEQIKAATADYFGVPDKAMVSHLRKHSWAYPRHIAMTLCRYETGLTLKEIARRFDRRDHTTVSIASKNITRSAKVDDEVASDLEAVRAKVCAATAPVEFRSVRSASLFKSARNER